MIKGIVYVQGDFCRLGTQSIFARRGYAITEDLLKADIVVWTGGEDISPHWYGEEKAGTWGVNETRDNDDIKAAQKAFTNGKFLVGICRGAQLLNVWPNKGTLFQDVDGHQGSHEITDYVTNTKYVVNSVHHQMMRPTADAVVVAGCMVSRTRRSFGYKSVGPSKDPEVLWYPKTKSLLFQGHPEFGHRPTTDYFFELMERYYEGKHVGVEERQTPRPEGTSVTNVVALPGRSIGHDIDLSAFEAEEEVPTESAYVSCSAA